MNDEDLKESRSEAAEYANQKMETEVGRQVAYRSPERKLRPEMVWEHRCNCFREAWLVYPSAFPWISIFVSPVTVTSTLGGHTPLGGY